MSIEELIGSLHPAIVHIPIGLLVLYALFELVPLRWVKQKEQWQFVKTVLLVCGTVGAFGALQSGDAASEGRRKAVIGMHELVAQITTFMFALLTVSQIIPMIRGAVERRIASQQILVKVWKVVESVGAFVRQRPITVVLACIGFVALFVTGALGGAIAHGVDVDPATSLVTKILGLQ